jgi:hypothetical protein
VIALSGIAAYGWRRTTAVPAQLRISEPTESNPGLLPSPPEVRPTETNAPSAPPVKRVSARETSAKPSSESELMFELRRLGEENSELAIALARDGNQRFPSSPDAPERARRIAKSLVNLGRFHEARDEAKRMLELYPGSPWTLEVERHLLVNPLDYPPREEQPLAATASDR